VECLAVADGTVNEYTTRTRTIFPWPLSQHAYSLAAWWGNTPVAWSAAWKSPSPDHRRILKRRGQL